jgi:hypothetical protein
MDKTMQGVDYRIEKEIKFDIKEETDKAAGFLTLQKESHKRRLKVF